MVIKKKIKIMSVIKKAVGAVTLGRKKGISPKDPSSSVVLKPENKKGVLEIATPAEPKNLPVKPDGFSLKIFPRRGQTQAVAFLRDPRCLYVYWEVTEESLESAKKYLGDEYAVSYHVLRVFRTEEKGGVKLDRELRLELGELSRYLELSEPTGDYFIEVGQATENGGYFAFARSNPVSTSAPVVSGLSVEPIDPRWKQPAGMAKYYEDLEIMGPLSTGVSSAQNPKRKDEGYFASRI